MCQYVTCLNEGKCQEDNTSKCFTCECKKGFAGALCEKKEETKNSSITFYIQIGLSPSWMFFLSLI